LTIVVVGGGPTGVEIRYVCRNEKEISLKEYPELATAASNIYLIDGGDALLSRVTKTYKASDLGVVIN
jgi:NADH dehydrogenase